MTKVGGPLYQVGPATDLLGVKGEVLSFAIVFRLAEVATSPVVQSDCFGRKGQLRANFQLRPRKLEASVGVSSSKVYFTGLLQRNERSKV